MDLKLEVAATESATHDDRWSPKGRSKSLRVVELSRTVAGAVCGRLFAALGHEVIVCEPSGGHMLRDREFTFTATAAGKRSVVCEPSRDTAEWHLLLSSADVLIHDLTPTAARDLELDDERLPQRFPRLVTVSVTPFGWDGPLADVPGDSFLAEAYGGLSHMIGEPDRSPLTLGGEQAAHAGAFVGLFGAAIALRRREQTNFGDYLKVALSDVAAYMDWKSDVLWDRGFAVPGRSGASGGTWRIVKARDGWIGVIFLAHHWPALVELIGDDRLANPRFNDPANRLLHGEELWEVIGEAIEQRPAAETYAAAQRLGLPFGYAASAGDLLTAPQLLTRGFVVPADRARRDSPAVTFPLPYDRATYLERAPDVGENAFVRRDAGGATTADINAATEGDSKVVGGINPLAGLLVLDFGTITAGAATSRLLADYGATVIKIESKKRPDPFRQWVMPGAGVGPTTSPMFASNNVGKTGLCLDLKTNAGRKVVHDLIRRADVIVENFRAGVTTRMGIDPRTALELNPNLIYLSLSSQGSDGPESSYSSYGSTLDLLSGLAVATGYEGDAPMWSSGDVNYPDQIVALAGAALVAHAVTTGNRGAWLDLSQRELVAWTLADQIGEFIWEGLPLQSSGNRRRGASPHDMYRTSDGKWIAIACFTDQHRWALTRLIPDLPGAPTISRWIDLQDQVDMTIAQWASTRPRDQAVDELRAADIPAVPVCTAADRATQKHYRARRVAISAHDGQWLKGFPFVLRGFSPGDPGSAPALSDDVTDSRAIGFGRLPGRHGLGQDGTNDQFVG